MSLKEYRKKRDFKRTPEPFGKESKSSHFKYLIQKHAASHLHYDLRLELNGVLKSWAVPKGPSLDPKVKRLAVHVEDHPLEYGDFEGIIPEGEYGGGIVMLWDRGTWLPIGSSNDYYKGHLKFELKGKKLRGLWQLIRTNAKNWLLMKIKDKYARPESEYNVTEELPNSVLSNKSISEIGAEYQDIWTKKGATKKKELAKRSISPRIKLKPKLLKNAVKSTMPSLIFPQLATLVNKVPTGNDWLHEIKYDGYRLITFVKKNKVFLYTRHQKDWTIFFPNIEKTLAKLKLKDCILDGEVVALDDRGYTSFQLLQNMIKENQKAQLVYYIFDIIYYEGYNFFATPLIERKSFLEQLFNSFKIRQSLLHYSSHIIGNGQEVLDNACAMSLEGIVSKKINTPYVEKRSKQWLKIKCIKRQEFVVGGFTKPKGSRKHFGALLLGYYDKQKQFVYVGRVGTGFNDDTLRSLSKELTALVTSKIPFDIFNERITRDIVWVKTRIVVEVEYIEITLDGLLRHPSFKGVRMDKKPSEVHLEKAKKLPKNKKNPTHEFGFLTSPDKILYPEAGITKQDLAEYYLAVQDWILPYIGNRPLSVVRCPDGYHQECFYQKHVNETVPDTIQGIPIKEKDEVEEYIYIKDVRGLEGLIQMSVLEMHPWGSTIKNIETPDRIIFDLDPDTNLDWQEVIKLAFLMKEKLEDINLVSFVKTTGGKGLHIVIPIMPKYDWSVVKNFAQSFTETIVQLNPKLYLSTMTKSKRKGKVFIDYFRNTRGATAVAAYSTRARAGAPISTPLSWQELNKKIKSDQYNISNIFKRLNQLRSDPWEDFYKVKQSLSKILKKFYI